LKYGLTDIIANIKLNEFLYNRSISKYTQNNNKNNISSVYNFTIPSIIHSNIAKIKMKDLVHYFRAEMLVFDLEKRNGILFNLPDILQCGMIGISGIAGDYVELWKILDKSLSHLKTQICKLNEKKNVVIDDFRSDIIDVLDIFGRVKMIKKHIFKEK